MAILWQALGYGCARELLGILRNNLIRLQELTQNIELVKRCINSAEQEKPIQKGLDFTGSDLDRDTILEILELLPLGMESALQNGKHFLSIACSQM